MNGLFSYGSTERDEEEARRQALGLLGLGMIGIPRGAEALGMQRAGLLALEGRDRFLENRRQGRLADLQGAQLAQQVQERQRAFADAEEERRIMREHYAQPPAGGGARAGPGGMPGAGMPGASPRLARFNAQMQLSEAYKRAGRGDVAARIEEQALKVLPKVKEVKDGELNGRRVNVVTFEDGTQEVSPYGPAMEKLHFANTGTHAGVGLDPFTGAQRSPGLPVGMSPTEQDTSARGWASHRLAQNADVRAAANEGRPQIITGPNGEVFTVNPRTGTGAPVLGPDGAPLSKGDKPLTETQAKATAFANQMQRATQTIGGLESNSGFSGKSYEQQARIVAAGARGIPYVPGSAAVPRASAGGNAQKYHQAELMWTEAALRFMTGANAPDAEVVRNAATYFPRPGDTPEVIEQKAQARANMEQSVRMAAGHGTKLLRPPQEQPDALADNDPLGIRRNR